MKLVKFYQYNYYKVCMLVDLATYFFYTLLLTAQICKVSDHRSKGHGFKSRRRQDWTSCLSQTTQWAQVLVHPGSEHQEQLSISSENLFLNRCKKISKFKPNLHWLKKVHYQDTASNLKR